MNGLEDLMKQAQAMQEKMQNMQGELSARTVCGESGAGMVKVVMNGRRDVSSVSIADELLSEDKQVLEDLLAAAINDAEQKVEQISKSVMGEMAGGFQLPPGFKLPF